MIVLTTPSIEGKRIVKYIGIVSGEAILGANIFKDFFISEQILFYLLFENIN